MASSDTDNPSRSDTGVEPAEGPLPLRVAVLILFAEAAGLGVLATVEFVKIGTSNPDNPGYAAIIGLMIAFSAAVTGKCALALMNRAAWARSMALMVQLCVLPVSWFMTSGEGGPATKSAGALIGLVSVACAALLLTKATTVALRR